MTIRKTSIPLLYFAPFEINLGHFKTRSKKHFQCTFMDFYCWYKLSNSLVRAGVYKP